MEIDITNETVNDALGRREIDIEVQHDGEATPTKAEVRKKLSATEDADEELVAVKWMRTEYGLPVTKGRVDIYDDAEARDDVESQHIIARNAGGDE